MAFGRHRRMAVIARGQLKVARTPDVRFWMSKTNIRTWPALQFGQQLRQPRDVRRAVICNVTRKGKTTAKLCVVISNDVVCRTKPWCFKKRYGGRHSRVTLLGNKSCSKNLYSSATPRCAEGAWSSVADVASPVLPPSGHCRLQSRQGIGTQSNEYRGHHALCRPPKF